MTDIVNNFYNKINEIINKNVENKINEIKNTVSKKIIELYKKGDVKKIKLNDILKLFDEYKSQEIEILYDEDLEVYKFKDARTFYVLKTNKNIDENTIIGKIKNNKIVDLANSDITKCKKNNWKYEISQDDEEYSCSDSE